MKKGLIFGIAFLFILIIFLSFVSAGFFSNFWGKITGKTIGAICTGDDVSTIELWMDGAQCDRPEHDSDDFCQMACTSSSYGYLWGKVVPEVDCNYRGDEVYCVCGNDISCGLNEICEGASPGTCTKGICLGSYVDSCTLKSAYSSCNSFQKSNWGGCYDPIAEGCYEVDYCREYDSYDGYCDDWAYDGDCAGTPNCNECNNLGPTGQPPQHCDYTLANCVSTWSQSTCESENGCTYTPARNCWADSSCPNNGVCEYVTYGTCVEDLILPRGCANDNDCVGDETCEGESPGSCMNLDYITIDCYSDEVCTNLNTLTCEGITYGTCEETTLAGLCADCSIGTDCDSGICAQDSESGGMCVETQGNCAWAWGGADCEINNGETTCVRDNYKATCDNGGWIDFVECLSGQDSCQDGACIGEPTAYTTCAECINVNMGWCLNPTSSISFCIEETQSNEGSCEQELGGEWITSSTNCPGCEDSDVTSDYPDGKNPNIAGTVFYGGSTFLDQCEGEDYTLEWYCDNDMANDISIKCSEGYKCQNKACVEETALPTICEDCVGGSNGYTWCPGVCVIDPTGICTTSEQINYANDCVLEVCIENYDWSNLIINENVKKYLRAIQANCGVFFEFEILDILPETVPSFLEENTKIVKILNITTDPDTGAVLDLIINETELDLKFPLENIIIFVEEQTDWVSLTNNHIEYISDDEYIYQVETEHFSLFLITEPDYCNGTAFEPEYGEECDGTDHCTECVCDVDHPATSSGLCEEDIEDDPCETIGEEDCVGYTLYECGTDYQWDKEGKVLGKCGVGCSPIGNMSCQGEFPLRCGTDYQWDIQSQIDGLCGYISDTTLIYDGDQTDKELKYCGNGYCGYNEDESNCPEDCTGETTSNKWMLPFVIAIISMFIILIIIVLFKIYNKERRRPLPSPNRRIPPMHRPGPKRPLGRPQVVRHGQIGRPPARKVSPGGYAIRRYPR